MKAMLVRAGPVLAMGWSATLTLILLSVSEYAMAIETLAYQVVTADGSIEVRDYPAHRVVETTVPGDLDAAGSAAFRRLFAYISGANAARQKIAMTAPVLTDQAAGATGPAGSGAYRTAFLVPGALAATAPLPADAGLRLRSVPAQRMVAIRYSGTWRVKRYEQYLAQLRGWMARQGLAETGPPVLARYDAPFMPWFLRRNEILIPTAGPAQ